MTTSKAQLQYEANGMLDRYLLRYWGEFEDVWSPALHSKFQKPSAPNFALKCVELVNRFATSFGRALDIGCCAGRATFELARSFEEVVGSEYIQDFVDAANRLKADGSHAYTRQDCGLQRTEFVASIPPEIDRSRVRFEQGDGSALPGHLKDFDAVLFANVLCRLSDPQAALRRMQDGPDALVKPGGILVMTSPFSWLEEYTAADRWIHGVDELQEILTEFELLHQEDIPLFFRDHNRRFEYVVPLATIWKRKG